MEAIFKKFKIDFSLLAEVKDYDRAAFKLECNFLREKKGPSFELWTPEKARAEFLNCYYSMYDLAFADYPF
jgi:hypothetical protein